MQIPPFKQTIIREACRILCYGIRVRWEKWGKYLEECDHFNKPFDPAKHPRGPQ